MEYIVNKDGTIEKEVNGYQIKINTPENKINYSIGGRVFKTLRFVPVYLCEAESDKLAITTEILDGDKMVDIVTVTKKTDSDTDLTNIIKAACKYAEKL